MYWRVMQDVVCYKEILQEKRMVAQHAYFSSKTSDSDDPQPSTSKKHAPQPLPRVYSPTSPPLDSEEVDNPSPPSLSLSYRLAYSALSSRLPCSYLSYHLSQLFTTTTYLSQYACCPLYI